VRSMWICPWVASLTPLLAQGDIQGRFL
jgi:hypothetical protein